MPSNETTQLKTRAAYDLSGGMVTNYNYSKVQANQLKLILNGDLTSDGSIVTRYGRERVGVYGGGPFVLPVTIGSLTALGQTSGADEILVDTVRAATHVGELFNKAGTSLRTYTDVALMSAIMDNYAFFVNGVDTPFITDGTVPNTYQIGIDQVTVGELAGFTALNVAGGAVSTAGDHRWAVRYRSTITGARGNPRYGAAVIVIGAGDQYRFDVIAAGMSVDTQVDQIDYFVQEAGVGADAPYYYLGSSANAIGTYLFNVSDDELMVLEVLDIDDNVAPVTLRDINNFKGRMVGISGDYTVRYSKKRVDQNGVVNLPTSWPATNEMNVGWGDGDPLVKVMIFNDYLFAFKRRSVWLLLGDFDSDSFQFKQLKTNFTNVGLLNKRCAVAAGDSMFFVSDDLKFHRFGITDFSTTELRLQSPPVSDRVANLFTSMASAYRQFVNVVNFTFSQYTQIWIAFTDGTVGAVANDNYSTFVYDYTSDSGKGAWHIHTGHEIASSVLARDADLNYYIFTGDYLNRLWKHGTSVTDGTGYNFTGTVNGANQIIDPAGGFTIDMEGCIVRCTDSTNPVLINEVRRVATFVNANTLQFGVPAWAGVGSGTFTVGGIDFQVQSRDDWLDDGAPLDYDKQGWYLDFDITSEDLVTSVGSIPPISELKIYLYKNRTNQNIALTKQIDVTGAVWDTAIWDTDIWPEAVAIGIQVGMNLYFSQISHKIVSQIAGQRLRVHGWTYHFQELGKLRIA
jgi:hypothetical protein